MYSNDIYHAAWPVTMIFASRFYSGRCIINLPYVTNDDMKSTKKTWAQKMRPDMQHEVKVADKDFADIPAGHTMLIATPTIVNEYVHNIPEGKHVSIKQMREDLAAEYHAEYTCPVTSGIFLRIVAENAWEELMKGKSISRIAPFWRMIDLKSPSAKKLACGLGFLNEMREKEGLPV